MKYGEVQTIVIDEKEYQGFRVKTNTTPPKVAILRLPTSDEMAKRIDAQKSVQKSLGRGQTQSDSADNVEADLSLFHKMRVYGDDFEEFEARTVLTRLTEVSVVERVREGDQYKITTKTPFCETVHRLKIPSDKALHFYRRSIVAAVSLPHGVEELRYRSSAGIDLYDSVFVGAENYAGDVPSHHKFCVAGELSEACKEFDPLDFDPNS